ncbi:LOW QUALITY PROTEIN: hypothetical protein Cgig2_033723 [Carnegiea gigantea]|uniref:Uncharacterized protein n=1 Tax=Carnegiea gigantea TaxID=171969 RepID=A0A9Q1K6X4_9CARY|nr:LOW QUALITY PROTEIN: hypothetical protein Cgig2_033723 [Carnegiea gigantea]
MLILVDTCISANVITWDCLRKLKYPRRDITLLVHPILGFNKGDPIGVTHLPLRFGDKTKSKNLELDFLVVDVPMGYNVIWGSLTLHKVKAVIDSYLLQIQYEANDGREYYLVSIKSSVECPGTQGPTVQPFTEEALHHVIYRVRGLDNLYHRLDPERLRLEIADDQKTVLLEEECQDRTIQVGRKMIE